MTTPDNPQTFPRMQHGLRWSDVAAEIAEAAAAPPVDPAYRTPPGDGLTWLQRALQRAVEDGEGCASGVGEV